MDIKRTTLIKMSTILCYRDRFLKDKHSAMDCQLEFKHNDDMVEHYSNIVLLWDSRIKKIDRKYEEYLKRL